MKDFISFRKHIRKQNLSVNEQYLIELFFEFHNVKYGYSFLSLKQLMEAFNTTSKNRVTNVIKSLEKKQLIKVDRENKNNRYYVLGIEKFLLTKEPKQENKEDKPKKTNIDSNGNAPIDGQITVEEALNNLDTGVSEQERLINETITTGKASNELKELVNSKSIEEVEEVVESVKLTSNGSVNSTYVLNAFNALNARKSFIADKTAGNVNPLKFNNFEPRQYNYDALEAMLLGHKEYDENDIHEVLSNSNAGNYTSNNSKRFMNGVQIGA